MKKRLPIGILICTLLLVACSKENTQVVEVMNTLLPKEEIKVDVYLPKELSTGKYEPETGVYLGVDVENNRELEGDMAAYEALVNKEQAFRVFQYKASGDISSKDILECIASKEVPYIKILPNSSYDLMPVYQMIGDLNTRYHTPFFIELFPVAGSEIDPLLYVKYYEDAYKLIKKYIKDAVVVWSIDWNQVYDIPIYYPGNNVVDWVGLNVAMPKYRDNKAYEPKVEEMIDFWYKTFQTEKPMMLSTLAISHFSRMDHTYTIEDAKNKLNYFYDTMIARYPRIKGVIYSDVDMYQISSKGTEDYRITSQEKLIAHLATLQSNEVFLSEVTKEVDTVANVPIKTALSAYRMNGSLYVTEQQIDYLGISKSIMRQVPCITDETMEKFYDLNALLTKQSGWIAEENLQN